MSSPWKPASRRDQRADAFARLFEAVHEGVYIGMVAMDEQARGTTLAANSHLKLMFGQTLEASEADIDPFATDRFADPAARVAFLERLADEGTVSDYLLRMRRLDGGEVWVEVTGHAELERRAPGTLRVETLIRDVSQRKRQDDQSRELYQQLLQAEKMAALGQTISGVAHELNNPLATILNWSERLAERSHDDTTQRGVEVIRGEAERAARIVRNLLTFARKRQSTRALIDLTQVVRETLTLRSYDQRTMNITVMTALASGLPLVFADAHQLQQVLLNLIINAEQAMLSANGRGALVIRTWHDVNRDAVVLEVTDDGPGVPAEVKSKIFDPFFTTKDVGKGTGLGLTVAYAIVQEHGGRIRVASPPAPAHGRPARGACFVVELPVSGLDAAAATPSAPQPSLEGFHGTSVLLVEDETGLAASISGVLTSAGLNVEYAGDGEEALSRMRGAAYDLVISDLKTPRVDGMMLYRAIAAATPSLARRVIFVAGDVAGTDAARFLDESACRWLAKPVRPADLLRAVRETLA